MNDQKNLFDVRTLVTLGMIAALAYAVMAVCHIIPKVGGFLSLDVMDAVIGIGGFLFGPAAVVCVSLVVSFLEAITISTTLWYGFFMNVLSTVFFLVPAVWVYRRKRETAGAVIGLGLGVLCRTVGMMAWNYIVTPHYFGMPQAAVLELMPTITLFNFVKGVLNAALIMLLYPPVSTALRKLGMVPQSRSGEAGEKRSFNYLPAAVSAVVLVTAVLAVWAMLQQ